MSRDGWIPSAERLPPAGGPWVLAWDAAFEQVVFGRVYEAAGGRLVWSTIHGPKSEITHWQPMPKRPTSPAGARAR